MGVEERRIREKEMRRDAILDAAQAVFARIGIENATMEDVAHEAELSKGALYLYFKSKDDLYLGVAARGVSDIADRFEAIAADDKLRPSQKLQDIVTAHGQFVAAEPHHFRTAVAELASGDEANVETDVFSEYRCECGRVLGAVVAILNQGKKQREFRADINPVVTATQLWGCMLGNMLIKLNAGELNRRFAGVEVESEKPIEKLQEDTYVNEVAMLLVASVQASKGEES